VNIAVCRMDKRGRITLPLSFLKANSIDSEKHEVVIKVVVNNPNAVKLVFVPIKGNTEKT
jgi:hypothetical protein